MLFSRVTCSKDRQANPEPEPGFTEDCSSSLTAFNVPQDFYGLQLVPCAPDQQFRPASRWVTSSDAAIIELPDFYQDCPLPLCVYASNCPISKSVFCLRHSRRVFVQESINLAGLADGSFNWPKSESRAGNCQPALALTNPTGDY